MCDDALCATTSSDNWQYIVENTLTIDIQEGIPSAQKYLAAISSG